ncbi:MAG: hypothetical protein KKA73_13400 [Chloroflexi bacterium]|nr:hypothetical protein [Chloroflexota bacterium]MBU1748678.1 hypothetical protein [Chloroflexota bacterium]
MSAPEWLKALGIPESCISFKSSAEESKCSFSIKPKQGLCSLLGHVSKWDGYYIKTPFYTAQWDKGNTRDAAFGGAKVFDY